METIVNICIAVFKFCVYMAFIAALLLIPSVLVWGMVP